MRRAVWVLAALVLLAVAVATLLPGWLAGDDARERLLAAVREATGHEVAAEDLSLALFPPRLVAKGVRVGDATAPLVTAEQVALRVDLVPLLARRLVVESLALDGVRWRVPRTKAGLEFPWKSDRPRGAVLASAPAPGVGEVGSQPMRLAVTAISLTRSQIVWDDTAASPPVRIELTDVTGEAHGAGPDAPLAVTLAGTLASGGTLRLARDPAAAGAPDLTVQLEGVDLGALAPYLGKDLALAGKVGGTISARGPAAALDALDAALEIADAKVRAGDVVASGPVTVKASLAGALEALAGSFELDATRADLSAYDGAFRKPPGAPAKATGKLVRDAEGKLGVDAVRVKIENMDGNAKVALEGELVASSTALHTEGLVATIGGQPVAIALRAEARDGVMQHRMHVAAKEVDARAILAAIAGRDELLEGPLTLDADLAGPLGANALAELGGTLNFALGPGRIPNVSPLAEAIDALDRLPEVGRVLNRKKTERRLEPFLGDRFDSMAGRFVVVGGRARTEALVLRYPGYRLELRGSVGLSDQALDAKGRLVLEPAIEAALAGEPAGPGPLRVIEIARVAGSVAHPELEIDQAGAVAFAASLTLAQKRDKWERKLDQALGEGKGDELLDALDGMLGKKERNREH